MPSRSGKDAVVRWGANNIIRVSKWTAKYTVDELDVTDSEGNGFGNWIAGVRDLEITLEGNIDVGTNLTLIQPGTALPNFFMTLGGGAAGSKISADSILVTSYEATSEVRGTVDFTLTGRSQGSFSLPAS